MQTISQTPMSNQIVLTGNPGAILPADYMHAAGQAANQAAQAHVFESYRAGKAANTTRRHAGDLAIFADFLAAAGLPGGDLQHEPEAWRGMTWGIVEAFKTWMLREGYAIGSLNNRLSTVKVYAKMATKAGAIPAEELAMIQTVNGFSRKEGKHADENRDQARRTTRRDGLRATKKAEAVGITRPQAKALKAQPESPQGRRDAVIMAILLDHGLRCGELALLTVENFDLKAGTFTFYRPKVDIKQTHKMTPATLAAVRVYLETDHPLTTGPLLLGSRKGGHKGEGGGKLEGVGMAERSITERVKFLGELVGISGLSAHDCRHYWATQASRNKTPLEVLKDAGGWSSLAMPARYIEAAKIANEGVNLGSD